jgi:ABC-type dipeptide/oligopeptide/nickel transport system permease component
VASDLGPRVAATVKLALSSIVVAATGGLILGCLAAANRGQGWDYGLSGVVVLGTSIPVFWLGLMLASVFSVRLGLLPSGGTGTWRHFVMPTACLATFSLAFIARMTRSSLLEVIGQDYVRTARAKGLSERRVVYGHALRNAFIPIVTVMGLRFGYMLGGAVVTESVFSWPGLGQSLVTAVAQRDIPMVQGILLILAAGFVVVNLAIDVLYAALDPRVRG